MMFRLLWPEVYSHNNSDTYHCDLPSDGITDDKLIGLLGITFRHVIAVFSISMLLYLCVQAKDEEIFQYARKILIGEMQAITFNEFLPATIGRAVPKYKGYNDTLQPDVSNIFATVAFRWGDGPGML